MNISRNQIEWYLRRFSQKIVKSYQTDGKEISLQRHETVNDCKLHLMSPVLLVPDQFLNLHVTRDLGGNGICMVAWDSSSQPVGSVTSHLVII